MERDFNFDRRIEVDGLTYICDVTHCNDTEYWHCADAKALAKWLTDNGAEVKEIDDSGCPQCLEVDRTIYHFQGEVFRLNQCGTDLFDWLRSSSVGEFTYYFKNIVFHMADGRFLSAFRDDISNFVAI